MTAPSDNRTYTGYWQLQNASGARFGIGAAGTGSFYVNIVVGSGSTVTGTPPTALPTSTITYFAVVSAAISANPSTYTGVCPITITVSGSITASTAGTVKYHFIHSDGSAGSSGTLTYTSGGNQTVSDTINASASGSDSLYIDTPNNFNFGGPSYTITCATATPAPTATPSVTSDDALIVRNVTNQGIVEKPRI